MDSDGHTALHFAVSRGRRDVVEILLTVPLRLKGGGTALALAQGDERIDIVDCLSENVAEL